MNYSDTKNWQANVLPEINECLSEMILISDEHSISNGGII